MKRDLKPRTRLLLWDYERGSLAYELLWLLILLFVLFVPASVVWDPMALPR